MRGRDRREQSPVLVRQDLGKTLGRGKPHLGISGFRLELAPRDRHRSRLHVFVGSDSDFEDLHGTIPFSRSTASTAVQKSASRVAASLYSYGRTAFSPCL